MSASEFEAVLGQACIKVEKALYERGGAPALEDARRALEQVMRSARDKAKLKALRSSLDTAAETIQGELANDEPLREGLWDCLDYIDYRL